MIRKRSLLSNISDIKRQKRDGINCEHGELKDTKSVLQHLASIFPVEKFQHRLPRIIMRHQIYAFISCRTEVDKCLNEMRKKGEIRLFKIGQKDDEIAIVYMKEYREHLEKCCPNNPTVRSFLEIVEQCPDISFSKTVLVNTYRMKEENIRDTQKNSVTEWTMIDNCWKDIFVCDSELVQQGVLTGRDVGCYWLSIPYVGEFVKSLVCGRRATLQHIKRTKYKEILQLELKQRKLPSKARLGIIYHIYDIIGSDLVTCVDTSTGVVLRLPVEQVQGH